MRQAQARDLRSFLIEPVEEILLEREEDGESAEDVTLQHTKPMPVVSAPLFGQKLRPYRLQRYSSRGVTETLASSKSDAPTLRPAIAKKRRVVSETLRTRVTEQLVPQAQTIVSVEPSAKIRHDLYVWLVLVILFLLVVLGGIGLDSLIASYHW